MQKKYYFYKIYNMCIFLREPEIRNRENIKYLYFFINYVGDKKRKQINDDVVPPLTTNKIYTSGY